MCKKEAKEIASKYVKVQSSESMKIKKLTVKSRLI